MGDFAGDPLDGLDETAILDEEIERIVIDASTKLDNVLTRLDSLPATAIRQGQIVESSLRNRLTEPLDATLGEIGGTIASLGKRLVLPVDTALDGASDAATRVNNGLQLRFGNEPNAIQQQETLLYFDSNACEVRKLIGRNYPQLPHIIPLGPEGNYTRQQLDRMIASCQAQPDNEGEPPLGNQPDLPPDIQPGPPEPPPPGNDPPLMPDAQPGLEAWINCVTFRVWCFDPSSAILDGPTHLDNFIGACNEITQNDVDAAMRACQQAEPEPQPDDPCPPCPQPEPPGDAPDIEPVIRNIEGLKAGECAAELPAGPVLTGLQEAGDFLSMLFGMQVEEGGDALGKLKSLLSPNGMLKVVGGMFTGWAENITEAYQKAADANDCEVEKVVPLTLTRTLFSFINLLTGGSVKEQVEALDQLIASQCPTRVPSPAEALNAWLADEIDAEELACLVRANNQTWDWWRFVAESARNKWDIPTLIALRRRGMIDEGEFREHARRLGWVQDTEAETLWDISPQIPFPSDLIRMMQRDTADMRLVNKFGMDAEFGDKYIGDVKRWAEWQGIPEDYMRHNWRAHWRIPSNTDLWTMLHRIGRNADGSFKPEILGDVTDALKQNDVLPFWIDRLVDISYSLPRLSQISRLAKSGTFTRQDVFEEFVKRGLESKTAHAMAITTMRDVEQSFINHPFVKDYAAGLMNETTLKAELRNIGASDEAIQQALHRGQLELGMDTRKACLAEVKSDLIKRVIDHSEAMQRTLALTGDNNQAQLLVEQWSCQRDSRSKIASASEVCGWFDTGLIDGSELRSRLQVLGYNRADANRVAISCENKHEQRLQREEDAARRERLREQRRNAAEERRLKREVEADARRNQTAAERQQRAVVSQAKREESERAKAEKARERAAQQHETRKNRVTTAAKTFCNRTGCDISETFEVMWGFVIAESREGLASQDALSKAAATVASSKQVNTLLDWESELLDIFEGA